MVVDRRGCRCRYVKFHWKTKQGEENLLDDEAVTVGGSNHSHATADLQDSIAAGDYPEWTLCIQTMEIADEDKVCLRPHICICKPLVLGAAANSVCQWLVSIFAPC